MKIVVLDGYTLNPGDLNWDAIRAYGDLEVFDETAPEDVVRRIGNAEVVFTNKTILSAKELECTPNVKFIGVLAAGYDVVDIAYAKEQGIVVCNTPGYGSRSVAQHAFALLLEITNQVRHHSDVVKDGKWARNGKFSFWDYPIIELSGKTAGIIGYGNIGKETAKIAKAFGMNVLYCDSTVSLVHVNQVSFEEVCKRADVIFLHCPLSEKTYHIVNETTLALMKEHAILINNSRGPLIKEDALYNALKDKRIYAAGLDVVKTEPVEDTNPLLSLDNCFITPHISWASFEARSRIMSMSADNLGAYVSGQPTHCVY